MVAKKGKMEKTGLCRVFCCLAHGKGLFAVPRLNNLDRAFSRIIKIIGDKILRVIKVNGGKFRAKKYLVIQNSAVCVTVRITTKPYRHHGPCILFSVGRTHGKAAFVVRVSLSCASSRLCHVVFLCRVV